MASARGRDELKGATEADMLRGCTREVGRERRVRARLALLEGRWRGLTIEVLALGCAAGALVCVWASVWRVFGQR